MPKKDCSDKPTLYACCFFRFSLYKRSFSISAKAARIAKVQSFSIQLCVRDAPAMCKRILQPVQGAWHQCRTWQLWMWNPSYPLSALHQLYTERHILITQNDRQDVHKHLTWYKKVLSKIYWINKQPEDVFLVFMRYYKLQ